MQLQQRFTKKHDTITQIHHVIQLLNLGQKVWSTLKIILCALVFQSISQDIIRNWVWGTLEEHLGKYLLEHCLRKKL